MYAATTAETCSAGYLGLTFNATSTACVLLTRPTTTEPCFSASCAYSTWNILPCGELETKASELGSKRCNRGSRSQGHRIVVVVISEHDGVNVEGETVFEGRMLEAVRSSSRR